MKRVACHITALLCFTLLTLTGTGQEAPSKVPDLPQEPAHVFKVTPYMLVWGPIPFTAEYRLTNEWITGRQRSTQLSISYLGKSPILANIEDSLNNGTNNGYRAIKIRVRGARLQLSHRFYLNDILQGLTIRHRINEYAPNGYYIAPHFSFSTAEFTTPYLRTVDSYLRFTHTNINLLIGRQFFFWPHMCFDLYTGLGYKNNIWTEKAPSNNLRRVNPNDMGIYKGNFKFTLGVDIGFYF